ncbi:uncharacterized protein E0L32_003900 [Thyridium curvatum]|uniref:Uncharacterized protein n=1 Tax=Thyridium curvatum TaxID=1093900 RepID=A0A507BGX7_9PEZI|nr:uncharacterized protein E0L32_003900 [Thyridium curvatum]TPX16251.1 hypothetical protein E0L32_003900 [Thyridium curvatum]
MRLTSVLLSLFLPSLVLCAPAGPAHAVPGTIASRDGHDDTDPPPPDCIKDCDCKKFEPGSWEEGPSFVS